MGLLCCFCFLISLSFVGFFPLPEKSLWLFHFNSVAVHFVYKYCLVRSYNLGEIGLSRSKRYCSATEAKIKSHKDFSGKGKNPTKLKEMRKQKQQSNPIEDKVSLGNLTILFQLA